MAWFLFIDESGHARKASPYEVLAGVAIQDRVVSDVISQLQEAESRCFGRRYTDRSRELKGKAVLKGKVFRHRDLDADVDVADIPALARAALDEGAGADGRMLKALALAKLDYVASVFDICRDFKCRAFASIVEIDALPTATGGLRKDYAYLFERFFYFLEDNARREQGIVVFDELEKSQSHLPIDQMHRYFAETAVGQHRASRIISEPFFMHSDLTTGIQIADLVAYVISWGFRTPQMTKPARAELACFAEQMPAFVTVRCVSGSETLDSRYGALRTSATCARRRNGMKISDERKKAMKRRSAPKPPLRIVATLPKFVKRNWRPRLERFQVVEGGADEGLLGDSCRDCRRSGRKNRRVQASFLRVAGRVSKSECRTNGGTHQNNWLLARLAEREAVSP